jgi:hypothetical protein
MSAYEPLPPPPADFNEDPGRHRKAAMMSAIGFPLLAVMASGLDDAQPEMRNAVEWLTLAILVMGLIAAIYALIGGSTRNPSPIVPAVIGY